MDQLAGALLKGFGSVLSGLFSVIPSYGVAIILLTVLVRLLMLPLTIKQTRSMQQMQQIQPKIKELQRKYKGDKQTLNKELMKLYQENQVNPMGGCLPLLLQLPVFFALYAVLRATVGAYALPVEPVPMSQVTGGTTVCRPDTAPSVGGPRASVILCEDAEGNRSEYEVQDWQTKKQNEAEGTPPSELVLCTPKSDPDDDDTLGGFLCESRAGPGHLPADSALYATIVEGQGTFLGMHLACSPSQAGSDVGVRQCADPGTESGVLPALPYYLIMAAMVGTMYYQQKQMQQNATGPQAQQLKMMTTIMPVFLGFISFNIAAGVLVYWVTTNAWQIVQQRVMLKKREEATPAAKDGEVEKKKPPREDRPTGATKNGQQRSKSNAGSRKKRRKR